MNMQQWTEKYRGILTDNEESQTALEELRQAFAGRRAILYGYGMLGRNLGAALTRLGIAWLAVDRNAEAIERATGFDVHPPQWLKSILNAGDYVLIASVNRLKVASIRQDLAALGTEFPAPLNGNELHITLASALCTLRRFQGAEFELRDCYECSILDNACPVLHGYLRARSGFVAGERRTAPAVKMIGYILGNICTLRCRNCCESVPYLDPSAKSFAPASEVLSDIRRYASACEYVTLLEFIGGEPFLHPELAEILAEALKIPNIGVLHVFTNGTVAPKPELSAALSDPRIVVYLSNYAAELPEAMQRRTSATAAALEAGGVAFLYGSNANWYDFSSFAPTGDDEPRLRERYEKCFLHTCNRLHRGRLYRCPHHFSGVMLGKLDGSESIAIHEGGEEELAARLEAFAAQPFAEACRYCPMPFNAPFVAPGIQL